MELTETLISTTPIEHNSFLRIDRDASWCATPVQPAFWP